MAAAIEIDWRNFCQFIRANDKENIAGFYEKFGFVKDDETYDEIYLFLPRKLNHQLYATNRFLTTLLGGSEEHESLVVLTPGRQAIQLRYKNQ